MAAREEQRRERESIKSRKKQAGQDKGKTQAKGREGRREEGLAVARRPVDGDRELLLLMKLPLLAMTTMSAAICLAARVRGGYPLCLSGLSGGCWLLVRLDGLAKAKEGARMPARRRRPVERSTVVGLQRADRDVDDVKMKRR